MFRTAYAHRCIKDASACDSAISCRDESARSFQRSQSARSFQRGRPTCCCPQWELDADRNTWGSALLVPFIASVLLPEERNDSSAHTREPARAGSHRPRDRTADRCAMRSNHVRRCGKSLRMPILESHAIHGQHAMSATEYVAVRNSRCSNCLSSTEHKRCVCLR